MYEEVLSTESDGDETGPYLKTVLTVRRTEMRWNPKFDQDAVCDCGHPYYRHFDTYEDMRAVGCKYCGCFEWSTRVQKAGLIPYYVDDAGEIIMAFMISSDPKYGGALPQIAKGNVDPEDESSAAAAEREAEEELGYVREAALNLFEVWRGELAGNDDSYSFKLYGVKVRNPSKFVKPGFETEEVVWMTNDQFQVSGRVAHRALVQKMYDLVKGDE